MLLQPGLLRYAERTSVPIVLKGDKMKKQYQTPKAEKLEFDYTETVTAASGCQGGAFRLFIDGYDKCRETATDTWVNPYGNQ